jgi:flavodoxin
MKIGIIVYSSTGNTYGIASRLYEKLKKEKCDISIERVEAKVDTKSPQKAIEFTKSPSVEPYDIIVFGSHVEAFSLCAVTKKYLEDISTLKGKKVICLVTEGLPYPWMGGNHAIRQMEKLCTGKGATILGTGIINWPKKNRDEKIEELTATFMGLIK